MSIRRQKPILIVQNLNRLVCPLIVLISDQIFKHYLTEKFNYSQIGGWQLNYAGQLLIGFLTVVLGSFLLFQTKNRLLIIGWGLIVGGATSNLFDRLVYGSVRDYLNLGSIFGLVNLADLALLVGVIFVIINLFRSRRLN